MAAKITVSSKNVLQQYSQKWGTDMPEYETTTLVNDQDKSRPLFKSTVSMPLPDDNVIKANSSECKTKKAAEKEAAVKMIKKIKNYEFRKNTHKIKQYLHDLATTSIDVRTHVLIDLENIPNMVDIAGFRKDNLIIDGYVSKGHHLANRDNIQVVNSLLYKATELYIIMDTTYYHSKGYNVIIASKTRTITTLVDLLSNVTQIVSKEELLSHFQ